MNDADASGRDEARPSAGAGAEPPARSRAKVPAASRAKVLAAALVFLLAFGVRVLTWQDTRLEVGKVQTAVTANYKHFARHLRAGGASALLRRDSPLADPDTLGHPPGYPAVVAAVSALSGDGDAALQLFQIACDSLAAVVLFLLVAELLTFGAGATAGTLAALSPQFAWNSVLLLPDTLAVLPLLAAVYCAALATRDARADADAGPARADGVTRRARRADDDAHSRPPRVDGDDVRPRRLALLFAAGALVGVSCWLRANALLLAPFLAAAVALLSARGRGARSAAALLAGALAVVGALTLRNAVVFGRFIPVSLGAGQTLLEGIADYDAGGRFGIPQTDLGIIREEAARHGRPDYAATLFGPDAYARDRERLARGLSVIKSEPVWFAGVMARRALSMLRLERARIVSPNPPAAHATALTHSASARGATEALDTAHAPGLTLTPAELLSNGALDSPRAQARLVRGDDSSGRADGDWLRLSGDDARRGRQFSSAPFALRPGVDYWLAVPLRVERGRLRVAVEGAGGGAVLASTLAAAAEVAAPAEQPAQLIELAFRSEENTAARLVLSNEDASPVASVGAVELRALGASSQGWTRLPRLLVRALQRLFLTATVLPLALSGLLLVALARDRRALLLLCVVPVYYMAVQSAVHTEYRYVLAVPHFLFALSAFALARAAGLLARRLRARRLKSASTI